MGIKLGDIVIKRGITPDELKGRKVAIDAFNILYQFLASIRTPDGYPLTNEQGRVVSHLKGLFSRTSYMMVVGMEPIYIFDGIPHELKRGTLDLRRERKEKAQKEWDAALEAGDMERARTKAQQTSKLSDEMVDDAKRLLDVLGIQWLQAPGEGEAQASYMCMKGDVYCASSQDFDSLLFGCPRLVRNLALSGRRKLPGRREWITIEPEIIMLEDTLENLSLSREQLVDMAILIGTDFNPGVKGIGPKKALALLREHGSLEEAAKKDRIPLLEMEEVRRIFLDPDVTDDYVLKAGTHDREGILAFLVDEMEFGRSGVERTIDQLGIKNDDGHQSSLDAFL